MIRTGILNNLTDRVKIIVRATGGKVPGENEPQDEFIDTSKLSKFDLQKIAVAKKIKKTRETIKTRDELIEKGKKKDAIKISNDVRKMQQSIVYDLEELKKINEEGRKGRISKKKIPKEEQDKRDGDIDLIEKHIKNLKELDMAKYKKKKKNDEENDADKNKLMEGAESSDPNNTEIGGGAKMLMMNVIREQDMEGGNKENLPEVDISESLKKLEDMRKEVDKGLDKLSSELVILKEKATDIGAAVDKSLAQLDTIEQKVDENQAELEEINDKVDEATKKTGRGVIYCIILVVVIVLLVLVVIVFFVLFYFLKIAITGA